MMNRKEKLAVLAQTKFLSLYDVSYKNKKNEEKHWIIASRKTYENLKGQYFEGKEEKVDVKAYMILQGFVKVGEALFE